jgi:hypothetical protein
MDYFWLLRGETNTRTAKLSIRIGCDGACLIVTILLEDESTPFAAKCPLFFVSFKTWYTGVIIFNF